MHPALLKITGLRKAFPGVLALDGVDFDLNQGEVHAVVGKNGAGKSTLISIISGTLVPDGGAAEFDGQPFDIEKFETLPIATVYQESAIFPNLSVMQNLFAGRDVQPVSARARRQAHGHATDLLKTFGLSVDPNEIVANLSPVENKVIAIIRAFENSSRILIFDEPSAMLSIGETEKLFELIRQAKAAGLSIIYISHRLEEIFQIADRVTVLRDGRVVYSGQRTSIDLDRLVAEIVGPSASRGQEAARDKQRVRSGRAAGSSPRFEVRAISHARGRFENVSFEVGGGEIVGLAGLVGAGKTEIGKTIFGAEKLESGEIVLEGKTVAVSSPFEAIRSGIVYVTEDRKHEGLFADMTIKNNICAPILDKVEVGLGMLSEQAMSDRSTDALAKYHVKATGIDQVVATLSGGNQQKVLLARWLQLQPKVLIVDEPTIGVDVSAREEIYRLLRRIAEGGTCVIFISSDLRELMQNADRIVTLHRGGVTGSYDSAHVSEHQLLAAVSGMPAQPQ